MILYHEKLSQSQWTLIIKLIYRGICNEFVHFTFINIFSTSKRSCVLHYQHLILTCVVGSSSLILFYILHIADPFLNQHWKNKFALFKNVLFRGL